MESIVQVQNELTAPTDHGAVAFLRIMEIFKSKEIIRVMYKKGKHLIFYISGKM